MEWINVKDSLPPDSVFEVLVKVDEPFFGGIDPRMMVAYFAKDQNIWLNDMTSREVYHVTHWMFLPEPPRL